MLANGVLLDFLPLEPASPVRVSSRLTGAVLVKLHDRLRSPTTFFGAILGRFLSFQCQKNVLERAWTSSPEEHPAAFMSPPPISLTCRILKGPNFRL